MERISETTVNLVSLFYFSLSDESDSDEESLGNETEGKCG